MPGHSSVLNNSTLPVWISFSCFLPPYFNTQSLTNCWQSERFKEPPIHEHPRGYHLYSNCLQKGFKFLFKSIEANLIPKSILKVGGHRNVVIIPFIKDLINVSQKLACYLSAHLGM